MTEHRTRATRRHPVFLKHCVPARRSGFSLIEVLIATTGLAALSVVCVTTICLLMTAQQQGAETFRIDLTLSDLADQLRSDAHTTSSVEWGAPVDDRIREAALTLTDGTLVTYRCQEDGVTRERQHGDQIISREEYHLPFGNSWFESDSQRLIVWRHERSAAMTAGASEPSGNDRPRRTYRVEAAIGLHENRRAGSESNRQSGEPQEESASPQSPVPSPHKEN